MGTEAAELEEASKVALSETQRALSKAKEESVRLKADGDANTREATARARRSVARLKVREMHTVFGVFGCCWVGCGWGGVGWGGIGRVGSGWLGLAWVGLGLGWG